MRGLGREPVDSVLVSSKSGGIFGLELGWGQDGEMYVTWSITKDVIWLSANQNRRTFQRVWDSKTKTWQEQMEWEGLGEERRGEELSGGDPGSKQFPT